MLPQRHHTRFFVSLHESAAKRRHLLGIVTGRPHAERLASSIGEYIQTGPKNPVDTTCSNLLCGGFGDVECQLGRARCSHAHCAGILANVDFIKETVDAAIFLIDANRQGDWVTRIVGNFLQLVAELGCLLGRCGMSMVML